MSEKRTENRGSQVDGRSRPEQDKDEFQAGTGYQPSTNQVRHEPLPASHDDDGRQEEARRGGGPARKKPSPGRGGRGHAGRGK